MTGMTPIEDRAEAALRQWFENTQWADLFGFQDEHRRRMAAALTAADKIAWRPTHEHRKGGRYRLTARGLWEETLEPVAIYDDMAANIWVRKAALFDDGRFQLLSSKERTV